MGKSLILIFLHSRSVCLSLTFLIQFLLPFALPFIIVNLQVHNILKIAAEEKLSKSAESTETEVLQILCEQDLSESQCYQPFFPSKIIIIIYFIKFWFLSSGIWIQIFPWLGGKLCWGSWISEKGGDVMLLLSLL